MVPPLVVAIVVAAAPPLAAGGAVAVAVGLEEGKTLSDIAKRRKRKTQCWRVFVRERGSEG